MWLLPWERWLPPYIVGPALVVIAISALVLDASLSWRQLVLLPLAGAFGAWGTWVWFRTGENFFRLETHDDRDNGRDGPK